MRSYRGHLRAQQWRGYDGASSEVLVCSTCSGSAQYSSPYSGIRGAAHTLFLLAATAAAQDWSICNANEYSTPAVRVPPSRRGYHVHLSLSPFLSFSLFVPPASNRSAIVVNDVVANGDSRRCHTTTFLAREEENEKRAREWERDPKCTDSVNGDSAICSLTTSCSSPRYPGWLPR